MELKLNIYKTSALKEVERTLIAEDFKLSTGVCIDLLHLINIDLFEGVTALSKEDQFIEIFKIVVNGSDLFMNLLKDVFDGLTDEDIQKTEMTEIVNIIIQIVKYSTQMLFSSFRGNEKN